MKESDPGHIYRLDMLDRPDYLNQLSYDDKVTLTFVKREGEHYPGNKGKYPGTTTQEVLRALIKRTLYVNNQIPSEHNLIVIKLLRDCLLELEVRAYKLSGLTGWHGEDDFIEDWPTCPTCGHLQAWCRGRHG